MPLGTGVRLGPYEILGPLGAGGMGEVYRARDARLDRDVAIKVLPESVGGDPDRRARFEREAKAVAALSHPNILAIHDTGTAASTAGQSCLYVVTELLDGETLRERLAPAGAPVGGVPVRKAVEIAIQIARGLAAAHEKGIVHRDLKPENVFLTTDGQIKLLDFGLAKVVAHEATAIGATATALAATDPGTVMGTAGYMAPEQVRGSAVDARTDLFALGAVLYEMLSGRRAFAGETAAETMTAILRADPPDILAARADLSPVVDRILRHCLEKNPGERFQTARDVVFALEGVSASGASSRPTPALAKTLSWRRHGLTGIAAAALVAAGVLGARLWQPSTASPSWSGVILGGPEVALEPRLSPSRDLLAFQAFDRGLAQVGVMTLADNTWRMLTRQRDRGSVLGVGWARDGASIFYDRVTDAPVGVYQVRLLGDEEKLIVKNARFAEALPDGSLLVLKLNERGRVQLSRFKPETGESLDYPVTIDDFVSQVFYARATADGRRALVQGTLAGRESSGPELLLLNLETGALTPIVRDQPRKLGLVWHSGATITSDGQSVLAALPAGTMTRIVSMPVSGGSPRTLFTVASEVWYLESAPDGSVYASVSDRPAELTRRSVSGDRTERVAGFPMVSVDAIAVLADGRTVVSLPFSGRDRLMAVQSGKDPVPLIVTSEETSGPVTPVGADRIGFFIGPNGHQDIAIAELASGRLTGTRIALDAPRGGSLAASPDGQTIYFSVNGDVWAAPVGGGSKRKVRAGNQFTVDPSGTSLVVVVQQPDRLRFVRVFLDGRPEREIVPDGSSPIMNFILSPQALSADGRLLVPLIDAWFNNPGVLDTTSGRVTRLKSDEASDYHAMAWLPDGQLMALHIGLRSTLWRFRPEAAAAK